MTVPRKRPLECPIEQCVGVLSGRWKTMILWQLLEGPQRYSELEAAIGIVPQRALTQALRELAADSVIARRTDGWVLTPLGVAMRPALEAMFVWGTRHIAEHGAGCADRRQSA